MSKLKGAPPGYVGYGEGGVLTEAVRRMPHAVILLDEVENAHPDVLALFDQLFDKGVLEDAEGLEVDFTSCLFVLTTDLGAEAIAAVTEKGERDPVLLADSAGPELLERFKPGLLGRLTLVPFLPLGKAEIRAIVVQKLARLCARYEQAHGSEMSVSDGVTDAIARRCRQGDSGARQIDRILDREVLAELSQEVLRRKVEDMPVGPVKLAMTRNRSIRFRFEDANG